MTLTNKTRKSKLSVNFILLLVPMGIAAEASAVPDLQVEDLVYSPIPLHLSEEFAITVRVRNLGLTRSPSSAVSVYLDQEANPSCSSGPPVQGLASVPALDPFTYVDITFSKSIWHFNYTTAGIKHLLIYADPCNAVPESNDNNNTLRREIKVGPDLIVTSVTPSVSSFVYGVPFNVDVVIENRGEDATGPFRLDLIKGSILQVPTTPNNEANSSLYYDIVGLGARTSLTKRFYNVTYVGYGTSSGNALWGWVDSHDQVVETDESTVSNKGKYGGFTISPPPKPDLVVLESSESPIPTTVVAGTPVYFHLVVKNVGPAPAYLGHYFKAFFDSSSDPSAPCGGTDYSKQVTLSLGTGGLALIGFSHTYTSSGTKHFYAFTDACADVDESNEGNNSLMKEIVVTDAPQPDLRIFAVAPTNLNPQVGNAFGFNLIVKNNSAVAAPAFRVSLSYVSGSAPAAACAGDIILDVPGLAAWGTTDPPLTFSGVSYNTAGLKSYWVWADTCGTMGDANPSDNMLGGAIRIQSASPPDSIDTDGDGTPDSSDGCPRDPSKSSPGTCGCGNSDIDANGNGIPDCNESGTSDKIDFDRDLLSDDKDNCPNTWNPDQKDADKDGVGDACQDIACVPAFCGVCGPCTAVPALSMFAGIMALKRNQRRPVFMLLK